MQKKFKKYWKFLKTGCILTVLLTALCAYTAEEMKSVSATVQLADPETERELAENKKELAKLRFELEKAQNEVEKLKTEAIQTGSEVEKLKKELLEMEIKIERLKKGYQVKGGGETKEYVTTFDVNTKS
ncbi:MAG: hypothetical protein J6R00_09555 [Lentisphaeria bacterium]|nr:hypothetical protein [Lentisphaeria bacterium]